MKSLGFLIVILIIVVVNLHTISNIEAPLIRVPLIAAFKTAYGVDLEECQRKHVCAYKSLNDFFTREIEPREIDDCDLVSPVDGYILESGPIEFDRVIQAKGKHYSLSDLLGVSSENMVEDYDFITIYLAPYNYHRVHMPVDGTLLATKRITGRSLPVNALAINTVDGLYSNNERVVMMFETHHKIMFIVLVGALFVDSISYTHEKRKYKKGEEIGYFNFGSTVIMVFDHNLPFQLPEPKKYVKMGKQML